MASRPRNGVCWSRPAGASSTPPVPGWPSPGYHPALGRQRVRHPDRGGRRPSRGPGPAGYTRPGLRGVNLPDVADLPDLDSLIVVAQTTQSEAQLRPRSKKYGPVSPDADLQYHLRCHCLPPGRGPGMSRQADALIVVGGAQRQYQRLVEISQATGIPTYHVRPSRSWIWWKSAGTRPWR